MFSGIQWGSWNVFLSLSGVYCIWNHYARKICLLSLIIYLLDHLFILVWTHEYLFYTLGYNPIPLHFLVTQIVPALTGGASFCQLLCHLDKHPLMKGWVLFRVF